MLHIIGLADNKTIADKIIAAVRLFPARIDNAIHREDPLHEMIIKEPGESLSKIQQVAQTVFPEYKSNGISPAVAV